MSRHRRGDLAGLLATTDVTARRPGSSYVRHDGFEMAGIIPELLVSGSPHSFRSYKLSGTYPRTHGPADAALSARFVHDRKILAEHETSLTAWRSCLARLGPVNDIETTVLDLPRLRHRMTVLRVRPDQASLAAVLRATLPPPCSLPSGLALVAEVEPFPRGAYYGLVGLIQPEPGRIALSQVLRTVFRWQGTTYAFAGAAVTRDSTPAGEWAEIQHKFASITIPAPATHAQPGRAPRDTSR